MTDDPFAVPDGYRAITIRFQSAHSPDTTPKRAVRAFRIMLFRSMVRYWFQAPHIVEQMLFTERTQNDPESVSGTLHSQQVKR